MTKYKLSRFKDRDTRKVFGTILGGKMLGILGALALMQAFIWLFGNVAEAAGLQEAATVSDDLVNPINTMWTLVAAFLVFFMQAGFMALEAGFARSRESANIMMECIVDTCLCGILYWAVGFAFQFGIGNGLIGAGDYVTYCFLPDHAQQGMIEPFTVTGETPAEPVTVEAMSTVGLHDFGFDVPEDFDGQGTVEVVNNGDQAHELTILDADDQTGQGGLTTTAPGTTGYIDLDLDLAPGDYTFVCFVTDPESGQIHLQLGMEQPVSIT